VAQAVYLLCAITSLLCAWLLTRGYRQHRTKLLFWAALCFVGLALNNFLVVADFVIFPAVDLRLWRTGVALLSMLLLLYGLVREAAK
jgi:hypothetical protein